MKWLGAFLVAASVSYSLSRLAIAVQEDPRVYCTMVAAYLQNHQFGHPDYRHVYASQCVKKPRLPKQDGATADTDAN